MKERPILFSAPMIRAILAGTKTQTRRLINPVGNDEGFVLQDYGDGFWPYRSEDGESGFYRDRDGYDMEERIKCPYGQRGDRLWVRETFQRFSEDGEIIYKADKAGFDAMNELKRDEFYEARWRPSIHMPRWASRILLEVTGVKVERLQDISEADAMAEGIEKTPNGFWSLYGQADADGTYSPRASYRALWESINGPRSWDANPWVWCVSFKRLEAA